MTYNRLARSGPLLGYVYNPRTKRLRVLVAPNEERAYRNVAPADLDALLACKHARRYNYVQRELRNRRVTA